jgi:hypothetical protein
MNRTKKKVQKDWTTDFAGPETQRPDEYQSPVPPETTRVYYGGDKYMEEHRQGYTHAEYLQAVDTARRQSESSSVGESRGQDWSKGVPARNWQGMERHTLDGVTDSSLVGNPDFSNREQKRQSSAPISFKHDHSVNLRFRNGE